jgi:hypothetical protein
MSTRCAAAAKTLTKGHVATAAARCRSPRRRSSSRRPAASGIALSACAETHSATRRCQLQPPRHSAARAPRRAAPLHTRAPRRTRCPLPLPTTTRAAEASEARGRYRSRRFREGDSNHVPDRSRDRSTLYRTHTPTRRASRALHALVLHSNDAAAATTTAGMPHLRPHHRHCAVRARRDALRRCARVRRNALRRLPPPPTVLPSRGAGGVASAA